MRYYTLSEIELIGEYTSKYRRDTQDLKAECFNHLRNEVSALILERKFHDIEMRFRKERRNTVAERVDVKKAYSIEHYQNHPDLAKVLDTYDTEISVAQNFVLNHLKILWFEFQTLHNGVAIIICTMMTVNSRESF